MWLREDQALNSDERCDTCRCLQVKGVARTTERPINEELSAAGLVPTFDCRRRNHVSRSCELLRSTDRSRHELSGRTMFVCDWRSSRVGLGRRPASLNRH